MKNFFCCLNELDLLHSKLINCFPNEKILCLGKGLLYNNFILKISKTHIVENDISKCKSESVKAIVCFSVNDMNYVLSFKKQTYLIFENISDIFNFNYNNNSDVFLLSNNLLKNYAKTKKDIMSICSTLTLVVQDAHLVDVFNNREVGGYALILNDILELAMFFEKYSAINIYNYNYFANLLIKILTNKLCLGFNIVNKTSEIFSFITNKKVDVVQASFLISFVFHKFIKLKNFIKLNTENYYEKFDFHKNKLANIFNENIVLSSYLTSFQTQILLKNIKEKYVNILKFNKRIFKINCLIFKNIMPFFTEKINANDLLKALSLASDYSQFGVATLMRNLGYLNVV